MKVDIAGSPLYWALTLSVIDQNCTDTCSHLLLFLQPFSDVNWTWVDDQTKKEIGLQAKDDGEFWMSYRDFCKQFQEVTICQYGPDFDGDGVVDKFGEEIQL